MYHIFNGNNTPDITQNTKAAQSLLRKNTINSVSEEHYFLESDSTEPICI